VGKSSLLNRLTGEDRAVVDPVAGTTVDPVDSLVEIAKRLAFVDTAGLRRRVAHASGRRVLRLAADGGRESRRPRSLSCSWSRASRSASRTSG
jgi:predicted GTPase